MDYDSCRHSGVLNDEVLSKIKEKQESSTVRDIGNYFVKSNRRRVNAANAYPELIMDIKSLLGYSLGFGSCRLIKGDLGSPIEVITSPVDDEAPINSTEYSKAYCLVQLKALNSDRVVRILINRKDNASAMVVLFEDCVWCNDNPSKLVTATMHNSLLLISGLAGAPSGAFSYQHFLSKGSLLLDNTFKSEVISTLN